MLFSFRPLTIENWFSREDLVDLFGILPKNSQDPQSTEPNPHFLNNKNTNGQKGPGRSRTEN